MEIQTITCPVCNKQIRARRGASSPYWYTPKHKNTNATICPGSNQYLPGNPNAPVPKKREDVVP